MKRSFEVKVYALTNDHSGQHIAGVSGLSGREFGAYSLKEVEKSSAITEDTIITVKAWGHICSFSLEKKTLMSHGVGYFDGITADFTLAISKEDMRVLSNEGVHDEEWYWNIVQSSSKRALEEQTKTFGGYSVKKLL